MYSARRTAALPAVGFPIRTSPDQSLVSGSPTLFAATHVLLRLLSPRHPSCALCSLVISLPSPSTPFKRRPGSSAARLIASQDRNTCLLAHMQLSKNGGTRTILVGLGRFELPTPRLSSVCSNQLSYRPVPRPKRPRISKNRRKSARSLKTRQQAHWKTARLHLT